MTKRKTKAGAESDPVDDRTAPVDPELQALQGESELGEAPSADDLNEALDDPIEPVRDTEPVAKYDATGLHLLGQARVPHLLLVLDGSDKDAVDAARAYCKAIRQSNPAKAAAIATHVGVNFGRS